MCSGDARKTDSDSYENNTKALIERFDRRPNQYFSDLMTLTKSESDSYIGLMAKIEQYLPSSIGDRDPVKALTEELFVRALRSTQTQWVRRNKEQSSVVEAEEDYIIIAVETNKYTKHCPRTK